MNDDDDALRDLLRTLSPSARDHLREVLIQDQADRDAIAARLLKYRNERGTAWADLVDRLSLDPELRRRYVRLLGEIEGELRVVSMLSCDVKGSTAMAETSDPEDWAEIMNGAFDPTPCHQTCPGASRPGIPTSSSPPSP